MCVSIHLECWLDKPGLLGLQWVRHTHSNSVTIRFQNFGSVNPIDVDSIHIQCALGECDTDNDNCTLVAVHVLAAAGKY